MNDSLFKMMIDFLWGSTDAGRAGQASPAAQGTAESRATFFAEEIGAAVAAI